MNTAYTRSELPLVPQDIAAEKAIVRACTAKFLAFARSLPDLETEELTRTLWRGDMATLRLVQRAAVVPTSTSTASALAGQAVAAFVSSLAPTSAGAKLINAGLKVPLNRNATVILPGVSSYPEAPFIEEGAAIPVGQAALTGEELGPESRLAIITTASGALATAAAESIEVTLAALLRESAAQALDSGLFSATAGSSSRPPGLLYGVTPIAATAGANQSALLTDLRNLVGAVSDAGGGGNVWLFTNPETAIALQIVAGVPIDLPLVPTRALAAGRLVAIDVAGFASAFNAEPEISISRAAAVHFEDTSPQALGLSGSPTVPIRSFFQQDLVGIRLILHCAWVMRAAGLVQYIDVTW